MVGLKTKCSNWIKRRLPGGLRGNSEIIGLTETFKLIFGTAFGYRRTMFWYLKRGKFKACYNFFYVKALVPVGEGAGAGLYFFIAPIIRKFPNLAPYPRYIEVEMTTICNKKCILCEHTYWEDQEERHLTLDEFKHIVSQFPKLKWTNLTGEGDAFLNPDYLKMIRYLKSKDIPVFLVDSFDNIDETVAKELVSLEVDGIYVSMDGATRATYNKIKRGCDFNRSLDHIKNLIRIKKEMKSPIPELCFRYVMIKENYQEIAEFPKVIRSLGEKSELGDGSRIEYCGLLEFDKIKDHKVEVIPEKSINDTIIQAKNAQIPVFFAHSGSEKNPPMQHCMAWMEPYIMMGGYVLPCCSVLMSDRRTFLREHAFGNIFEEPFEKIWNSERYVKFRESINKKDNPVPLMCVGCRAYDTVERAKTYGINKDL